jgi:hypothetical protein
MNKSVKLSEVSNGAKNTIDLSEPYIAHVTIQGTADILFHRWNNEAVEEKAKSAKGSKGKKTDDVESYVYRNGAGFISVPGEYLRQSIIAAAKFRQDPRSPRKSAMDLYKAGVLSLTDFASLGVKEWDYEDRRRVTIQRAGITRVRPALRHGWKVSFDFLVALPEYIAPTDLRDVLDQAGRLIGIGDFRPTYGRFNVAAFELQAA